MVVGFAKDDVRYLFEELMDSLSFSGIGGKRSSGLGKFSFLTTKMPQEFLKRLNGTGERWMTLSCSLPVKKEMVDVLDGASYILEKRSGFVASELYTKEQQRKRDLYVFAAGTCVKKRFHGDVYDVSDGGSHSVYRYAKPMFLEVGV